MASDEIIWVQFIKTKSKYFYYVASLITILKPRDKLLETEDQVKYFYKISISLALFKSRLFLFLL